jgi:hypothetical protein
VKLITPKRAAKFRSRFSHKWRGTTMDAWRVLADQRHIAERPIVLFHSSGMLVVRVKAGAS